MSTDIDKRTYVSLDLETTGLSPDSDDIIEVGAIKFRDGQTIEVFHSLVNPHRPVPYRVQSLCHIAQWEVDAAPSFGTLAKDLAVFLGDHPIIGHNIPFDLAFLAQTGMNLRNAAYDTFDMAKLLLPYLPERSLSAVAAHLGIPHDVAHRALDDAEMGKRIFTTLIGNLYQLHPTLVNELGRLTRRTDWWLGTFLQAIASERCTGTLLEQGAFEQVCFAAPEAALREPLTPGPSLRPIDINEVAGLLAADGPLAKHLPDYETRPQQVEMLQAVAEALNEGEHLVVEAGTGVGKSIAYLLPAVVFAHQNDVPVVVSTNTINLQEQLVQKDIPDLLQVLRDDGDPMSLDIRVAQVKGRTNYLCLRRWDTQRRAEGLPLEAIQLLARIQIWLPTTQTGDRSEINIDAREIPFWHRLCAQSYDCMGKHCTYQQRGLCFLHRARRAAHSAHMIVINHALLLSDIASGARILPEYSHLIIDEAHRLEGVATDQLGARIRERDVFDLLGQVLEEGEERRSGLLPQLESLVRASPSGETRELEQLNTSLGSNVSRARSRASDFFAELGHFLQSYGEGEGEYDLNLRITRAMRTQPAWSDVEISCENLLTSLDGVIRSLQKIGTCLEPLPFPDTVKADTVSLLNSIEELRRLLDSLVFHQEDQTVHWITLGRRNNIITLHSAPLHVGSILQETLYGQKATLILTSATLGTEGNFHYLKSRLGFEMAGELALGSPFDYERAALVYLATDIPEPGRPGYQNALAETLIPLCRATEGRCLVLFTSHSALRAAQAAIQAPLEEEDILVLAQGIDGSPRKLLTWLRDNPRTVLLGAASFWEGVDVVGDALSLLVIVRLPFSVPTDPVFAARSETFENPFTEYALPQTAFKFKQGFGRLIRSKRDRGAMVVLDSRIVNKSYGSIFLKSLPACRVEKGPTRHVSRVVLEWLQKGTVSIETVPASKKRGKSR